MTADDLGPGPLDEATFPPTLAARVVDVGPDETRLAGYAVESDLAHHYGLTEVLLLAATGELPDARQLALAEVALIGAAPVSPAEAAAHAALLVQLCGGRTAAIAGVAALGLAEQLDDQLEQLAELWPWLRGETPAPPSGALTDDPQEQRCVTRLHDALRTRGVALPTVLADASARLTRWATIVALLQAAGIDDVRAAHGLLLAARLPCLLAEAYAQPVGAFKDYPMNLPRFMPEGGGEPA